ELELAHDEADQAEHQHDVDVEHAGGDGERADHAQHEHDGHQPLARHQQDLDQRPHQHEAEDQLGHVGDNQHGDDLVEELRRLHHQVGAGIEAVDHHGRHQHG